jgi:hypothetical protein
MEVAQALSLLSDGAFKLFMWICLNADRGVGAIRIKPDEIARPRRQSEASSVLRSRSQITPATRIFPGSANCRAASL